MFGTPSRNRIRSITLSACFISSIDSSRVVLGQALEAPVAAHLRVDEVLVDGGELGRQDAVQRLDHRRVAAHVSLLVVSRPIISESPVHRKPLLDLLERYLARHPDERVTVDHVRPVRAREPRLLRAHVRRGHMTGVGVDRVARPRALPADAPREARPLAAARRPLGRRSRPGGGRPARGARGVGDGTLRVRVARAASRFRFDVDVHVIPGARRRARAPAPRRALPAVAAPRPGAARLERVARTCAGSRVEVAHPSSRTRACARLVRKAASLARARAQLITLGALEREHVGADTRSGRAAASRRPARRTAATG